MSHKPVPATAILGCLLSAFLGSDATAQGLPDIYRITGGVTANHMENLNVEIQNQHDNGKPTAEDADDYTSVAFWYQEEPHRPMVLAPFAERTAPSLAGIKKN